MNRVTVRAAGAVPFRGTGERLQVALVHRPRYDDWSWPKGKLDRGEDWAAAAARETLEETGLRVRLGMPLPESAYTLQSGGWKRVRYWAAEVVDGTGELEHEVDEVAWLGVEEAAGRLTYARDRDQLDAVAGLLTQGRLATWPLLVVRHAVAVARGSWSRPDPLRPLDEVGRRQAARMVPVLQAYAPVAVLSSPAERCVATVRPFLDASGAELLTRKGLSEEGFEARPGKVDKHLARVLEAARPTVLCSHGPLFGPVLSTLRRRAGSVLSRGDRQLLSGLARTSLDKGEILVCTMRGTGADATVEAVERHRPPH
ncbi:NUDIX hydrolase [Ornithinimicrobium cerasi]|uniref:NUDIX hydrolase n=1 Tax=Ornithinimicrobium cerasi TaxID=2248773 RepID=UPI000F010046|nr:NUDIX hydrolase [Ornithinimicrobium cerasi]